MNRTQSNKTLIFIIILLLLTNILVLCYFLFSNNYKHADGQPKGKDWFVSLLKKDVGFNDDQVARFKKLKESHWSDAKANMDEIVKVKNTLFELTKQPNTPDSVIEKLTDSIGALQKKVEVNFYHHIVGTRKICTAEQQAAYDTLMKKIINKAHPNKPNKK